jgi:L-alanine-DL-glutamate epimerase-like enolase superfamily enzyme
LSAVVGGRMVVPKGVGLGVRLDPELVRRYGE